MASGIPSSRLAESNTSAGFRAVRGEDGPFPGVFGRAINFSRRPRNVAQLYFETGLKGKCLLRDASQCAHKSFLGFASPPAIVLRSICFPVSLVLSERSCCTRDVRDSVAPANEKSLRLY